jgi:hypothetical protein
MSFHFGNVHFTAQVKSRDEVFKKAVGGDKRKFPLKNIKDLDFPIPEFLNSDRVVCVYD